MDSLLRTVLWRSEGPPVGLHRTWVSAAMEAWRPPGRPAVVGYRAGAARRVALEQSSRANPLFSTSLEAPSGKNKYMCGGGCGWRQTEGEVFKLGEAGYLQSLLWTRVNVLGKAQVIAHGRPAAGLLKLVGAVLKLLSRLQGSMSRYRPGASHNRDQPGARWRRAWERLPSTPSLHTLFFWVILFFVGTQCSITAHRQTGY